MFDVTIGKIVWYTLWKNFFKTVMAKKHIWLVKIVIVFYYVQEYHSKLTCRGGEIGHRTSMVRIWIFHHIKCGILLIWKIQKNWCTVTVVPTIEHHSGHSRTPANRRWDQVPGSRKCTGALKVCWSFPIDRNKF